MTIFYFSIFFLGVSRHLPKRRNQDVRETITKFVI